MLRKTILAILLFPILSFAQENCTIKMSMKIEGLPPEYAGFGEQETVTYMKGDKTKIEITSMMGSQTVVFDGKKQTSLSDAMGNKTGYVATKEELESNNKKDKSDEKPKIEYTGEKKLIAGQECTKAIVTALDKEKQEQKMTVWVTEKIKGDAAKHKRMTGRGLMDFGDIKGYPLEIEMKKVQNGMEMKVVFIATEVSFTPIDESAFALSTEGYTMMSLKEYQEQAKAMGR